ncbi:restriction endonuclease subunit S [Geobacillus stearothermophilus]|nr:restriction endonuclease subunit S [Geobacillus stearothermophilus]
MNIGSAQPSIKVPHLLDLTVDIPTIETQKKIVGILKSLDDKIELNLKMNETLEEMAMTLYKHWFVENEDLERVSIEEFGSIIGGGTPKTTVAEYWDGNIPWISVKDLNSAVIIETEKKITEAGLNNSSTKLLPPFSTVLSARGTIGNISIIGKEMTMNQSCYAIKAKDELDCFVFLTLKSSINTLISQSHGSVFNTITKDTLKSLELPFNKDFAIKFEKKVKPMFLQILSNTLENKELQDIRDYLLPRLLSGEIDLSKAEKQVEKVL